MCDIGTNYIKTIKATTLFVVFLFVHSWEQRKFNELYEKVSEKNDLTYGTDEIISVANMYFKSDSFITDKEYLRTYNVFHLGDIAFEGNKSKNFAHGRFVENTIGDGIVSHVFDVFRPKIKYDLLFWKYAINNERLMGGILVRSTKASTMMTNLVANDFLRETILVPSLEEQKKIGSILENVDNLITLHQRKDFSRFSQILRRKKHSFLPISWEQRKLGDYFIERNERSGDGEMISVTINSGIRKFDELNRHDTKPDDLSKYKRVEIGDIAYNSMRMWQGASGYSPYSGILSPAYTVITPKEGVSSRFFAYLIKRPKTIHLFEINSQGLTKDTWNLKFPAFAPIEVKAPVSYEEQVNISRILIQLDNLITLHQRECFYIYKKYLLFLEMQNSHKRNYSWEQRKLWQLTIWDKKFNGVESYKQVKVIKYPYVLADVFSQIEDTSGTVRLLSTGSYIGYTTKEKAGNNLCYGEIVAIPWGGVANIKYYNGFFVTADNRIATSSNTQVLSNRYLHWWMESNITQIQSTYRGASIQHPSMNDILSLSIYLPSIEEQEKISNKLDTLDNLITLHQCESCKKVGAVQSAFARRNLSKWADSWEQRKLGETTQIIMGQSPDGSTYSDFPTDYILVQGNADLENGWVKPRIWTTQKTKYAVAGDLIMSVRAPAGSMGKTAYNVVLGRGVAAIKGNEFIFQVLTKMDLEGFWKKLSAGSTFESLNSDNIINANINLPSNLEQDKIGSIFENIDNLITLHQCKVFYKNIIFKNIKFGGLETENDTSWEQRKFEDAFIERREKTVTENEDTLLSCAINGMFLNSELFGHFRGTTTIGYLKVKKNDLILSAQNLHLGNANVNLRFEHGIISPAYKVYDLNNCEPEFVQAWVKKEDTKNFFLAATTEGASQCRKNIEWDTLGKQTICMPAIKEQATIGSFFKCVDNLITLHQRIKIFFTGDYHDKKNK